MANNLDDIDSTVAKRPIEVLLPGLVIEASQKQRLSQAILSTLAFFSLYELPLSSKRIFELLLGTRSTQQEIEQVLSFLSENKQIISDGNLYALKKWNAADYNSNQLELTKKWQKIDRYFNWFAFLPFVRQISVINSLALGTADSDSDIDFFVITKPNRLYFVRSVIIVLFRLLGVYKTRQKIKDRFCFGFFVAENKLELRELMLKPEDPYFVFWLANLRPILGKKEYARLMNENAWINTYFPNLEPVNRYTTIRKPGFLIKSLKLLLEVLFWLPSLTIEPLLRRIHINHTFKLSENNTVTSTTIANKGMLKLHGYDVRTEVAYRYSEVLQSLH